jgi:mRNA interferase RelE/StbE
MSWSIEFLKEAEADFEKLDSKIRKRVVSKLEWLEDNFEDITPLALTGEFQGFYKLRIGEWRIIYKIYWKKNLIIVCYIDKRDKIYK